MSVELLNFRFPSSVSKALDGPGRIVAGASPRFMKIRRTSHCAASPRRRFTIVWRLALCSAVLAAGSALGSEARFAGQELQLGYSAQTTASGHLNGDGYLDMVVVHHKDGSFFDNDGGVSIALGDGVGTFASSGRLPLPEALPVNAVALGDIDLDGDTDIVLGVGDDVRDPLRLLLFRGRGDGTFTSLEGLADGTGFGDVIILDLNDDGIPDLISCSPGAISVFLGDGFGALDQLEPISVAGTPWRLASGDINEDGIRDIVSANRSDALAILLGRGDGTFRSPIMQSVEHPALAIAIAYMDADAHLDLIVGFDTRGPDWPEGWHMDVLLGNGTGEFGPVISHPTRSNVLDLAAGDFNGDGAVDVVGLLTYEDRFAAFWGNDDGTLTDGLELPMPNHPQRLEVADTDQDCINDFIVSGPDSARGPILVLGKGDGSFGATQNAVSSRVNAVALADLDANGLLDAAIVGSQPQWLPGLGDGTFAPAVVDAALAADAAEVVAAADLDDDGSIDLLTGADEATSLRALLNNGLGVFTIASTNAAGAGMAAIAATDMDNNGTIDALVAANSGEALSFLAGNGDGTFAPAIILDSGRPVLDTVATDMNADTVPDAVYLTEAPGSPGVLKARLSNGDGTFQAPQQLLERFDLSGLAAGDLNGDGHTDLATWGRLLDGPVNDPFPQGVLVCFGRGDGSCSEPLELATPSPDLSPRVIRAIEIRDLDADGYLDVSAVSGDATLWVWAGLGDGAFSAVQTFTSGGSSLDLDIGDMNGDGLGDVVVANGDFYKATSDSPSQGLAVLIQQEAGAGFAINFPDFSDARGFVLSGVAQQVGDVIRVARAQDDNVPETGQAFLNCVQPLGPTTSIASRFRFRLHNPLGYLGGADGMTFTIHNAPGLAAATGGGSHGMGYANLAPSLAVEFDTYYNPASIYPHVDDPDGNHIGLDLNGSVRSIVTATPSFDLNGGQEVTAWVDYDGFTGCLDVYVAESDAKPAEPTLSYGLDLSATVGSRAVLGFTAGTFGGSNDHDILSWQLEASTPEDDIIVLTGLPANAEGIAGRLALDLETDTLTWTSDDSLLGRLNLCDGETTPISIYWREIGTPPTRLYFQSVIGETLLYGSVDLRPNQEAAMVNLFGQGRRVLYRLQRD